MWPSDGFALLNRVIIHAIICVARGQAVAYNFCVRICAMSFVRVWARMLLEECHAVIHGPDNAA